MRNRGLFRSKRVPSLLLVVAHSEMTEPPNERDYEYLPGLRYGADWHRYRPGTAGNEAHEHGDALMMALPSDAADTNTVPVSWSDLVTEARIAATTSKVLLVYPSPSASSTSPRDLPHITVKASFLID
jgi:hypothetical protein